MQFRALAPVVFFSAIVLSCGGLIVAQETVVDTKQGTILSTKGQSLSTRFPTQWSVATNDLQNASFGNESKDLDIQNRLYSALLSMSSFFNSNPSWRTFLDYDALLKSAQPNGSAELNAMVSPTLLRNWSVARDSLDVSQLTVANRFLREWSAVLHSRVTGETAQMRQARLASLDQLFQSFSIDPTRQSRIALNMILREMELHGQSLELVREIRNISLLPNLIIQKPITSLIANQTDPLSDSFSTSGFYNRMRMDGNGTLSGTQSTRLLPNPNAIEWEVTLNGTSRVTSRGAIPEVSVQSTAASSISAAKRIAFYGWGRWSYGQSVSSAPTTIRYDSISPNSRGAARQRTISEVQSSQRSSEIQAQQETEKSLRERLDRAVESFTRQLDMSPLMQLRDTLVQTSADFLTIQHRSSSEDGTISIRCYDHALPSFAESAPPLSDASRSVASIHESLLSLILQSKLMKSQLGVLIEPAKSDEGGKVAFPVGMVGSNVRLVFQPTSTIEAVCDDTGFKTIIRLKSISDGKSVLEDCRIEIDWDLQFVGAGLLRMVRKDSIKILPIDFESGNDRLGMRQVSAYRAVERSLVATMAPEQTLDLPSAFGAGANGAPLELRIGAGWLQLIGRP